MNRFLMCCLVMIVVGLSGVGSAFARDCCLPGVGEPCKVTEPVCSAEGTSTLPVGLSEPLELDPEWRPFDGSTVMLQILGGLGGGALGLWGGIATDSGFVGVSGIVLGTTLGIGLTGHLMGGNGSLLVTGVGVAGGLVGGVIPAFLGALVVGLEGSAPYVGINTAGVVTGAVILSAATIGFGIITYHLTASSSGSVSAGLMPTQGGAVMTLGGKF